MNSVQLVSVAVESQFSTAVSHPPSISGSELAFTVFEVARATPSGTPVEPKVPVCA